MIKWLQFPELRQTTNFTCGSCSLVSILTYYGVEIREDKVMEMARTNAENGTDTSGIKRVLSYYGVDFKAGNGTTIKDLKKAINNKQPALLAIQAYKDSDVPYLEDYSDGHWVCSIGYDAQRIYFEDPSSFKRTFLSYSELLDRWHDVESDGTKLLQWACITSGTPKFKAKECVHMD